ncbi:Apolipoprotein N-acyltransferase / Copper homeostasis protein CutE [Rubellimicrobium mesophilum DSM 19309]|uniref:Apolipoprotein N-acyltransferase n=1 Tax=Rubellimicrobium mesophilum DSM 19309 TaxID=442562 RepID=A0A017HB31_9RHOB|nr:apolipoprotein N-acyltransferase [Rubellimicrobium mesophilum]EYD71556.1 Apolipoprotein N-acyltransferase / Copper homeostasis protein CutE [Rubellimicrobium mesophilum DSM 19309]
MTTILGDALFHGPRRLAAAAWPLRLGAFAVLGALMGLGQVPFAWPVVAFIVLIVVMGLARHGAGFREGWALGLGYFALTLRWIVEPFLVEPERTGWMAPFALFFMAAGFALFWGAAFGLARRLRLGLAGLVALWAGVEVVRSLAFTGFPWALVGHVWSETPLAQLVAVVGVHGLTLLTLGAAAVVASPGAGLLLRGAVPVALAAGWVLLDPGPVPAPDPGAPVVRIVQPNVPQAEKWDPELQPEHFERLLTLSRAPSRADLVVWPETALTELLDWAGPTFAAGSRMAGGVPIASGVVREDEEGRYYNSLAVTDGQGRVLDTYDKVHLVPFGEYIPFHDLLSRWGLKGLADFQGEGFTSGAGGKLVDIPGIGTARPLICYEGIFAEEIGAERPRFLLLVTNDAWFGANAGPQQHFTLGRLRAIEQGLPLVRAANTGISAMIDGKGRILGSLPLNQAGAIEAPLPPALAPTPYSRWGDGPVLVLLGLLLAIAFLRRGLDPATPRP